MDFGANEFVTQTAQTDELNLIVELGDLDLALVGGGIGDVVLPC